LYLSLVQRRKTQLNSIACIQLSRLKTQIKADFTQLFRLIETTNSKCILGTSFVGIAIRELNLSGLQAGFTHSAAEFIQATFRFQADFIQPSFNCT